MSIGLRWLSLQSSSVVDSCFACASSIRSPAQLLQTLGLFTNLYARTVKS